MLIYVDQVTERLQFTLDFVFTRHGLDYRCTNDQREFLEGQDPRLNYSEWDLGAGIHFKPSTLLFEETIRIDLVLEKSTWENVPLLAINGETDPFAAIFYVLSRYEEYTNPRRDQYGRFEATSSILYHFGWLSSQIVERWTEAIVAAFHPDGLPVLKSERKTELIPSFDIDNTYAYKWKDGWRKWLAVLKDMFRKNKDRLEERRKVNRGELPDPYDTFGEIERIARRFPQTRIFWLLGDYSQYDRNLSWHDPRHQRLIRNMSLVAKVGLHPSYASNSSDKALYGEQHRLSTILGRPVTSGRQHFLKLQFPATYNRLLELGFKKDFSMGYSDQPGFRAGTAHPFLYFDLSRNLQTDLLLLPFVYMEGTFKDYLRMSPEESKTVVAALVSEVKAYGGIFCCIWHNESIGTSPKWEGWSELLTFTLAQFKDESGA